MDNPALCKREEQFYTFAVGKVKHSRNPVDVSIFANVLYDVAKVVLIICHRVPLYKRYVANVVEELLTSEKQ